MRAPEFSFEQISHRAHLTACEPLTLHSRTHAGRAGHGGPALCGKALRACCCHDHGRDGMLRRSGKSVALSDGHRWTTRHGMLQTRPAFQRSNRRLCSSIQRFRNGVLGVAGFSFKTPGAGGAEEANRLGSTGWQLIFYRSSIAQGAGLPCAARRLNRPSVELFTNSRAVV